MKVIIQSPGPLDVKSFGVSDPETGQVLSVPNFYGKGKEGIAAVLQVFTDDGKLLRAALLVIDGATGKMSLQDRSAPGKAAMEREAEFLKNLAEVVHGPATKK